MQDHEIENLEWLLKVSKENRERLTRLARIRINPMLLNCMEPEDLVQETFLAATRQIDYLRKSPEIPVFVKFRTLLLQTMTGLERKYLLAQKRDLFKETRLAYGKDSPGEETNWNNLPDPISSPRSKLVRADRIARLRDAMVKLRTEDEEIIRLRLFEELSNLECASVLGISPKASSARFITAIRNLKKLLSRQSGFPDE